MSGKVVLPREVAEAIDTMRKSGYKDYEILRNAGGDNTGTPNKVIRGWAFSVRSVGSADLLMQALVNGYEVEKTPEEKMQKKYQDHAETASFYVGKKLDIYESQQERYSSGYVRGVKDFADFYGIKIEGVNG